MDSCLCWICFLLVVGEELVDKGGGAVDNEVDAVNLEIVGRSKCWH